MSKTPTETLRHALNGPVMGTSWSALFYARPALDDEPVRLAVARAVARVDRQMSTWKPESDLMRVNRAPVGAWVDIPPELMAVLARGLEIGRLSGGGL